MFNVKHEKVSMYFDFHSIYPHFFTIIFSFHIFYFKCPALRCCIRFT